jgi:NAD-dependent dihydropyrimidine dehydrogenase PreA subunit
VQATLQILTGPETGRNIYLKSGQVARFGRTSRGFDVGAIQPLELGESRIAVRKLGDEQLEGASRKAEARRHGYACASEGAKVRAFASYYRRRCVRCAACMDICEEQSQR